MFRLFDTFVMTAKTGFETRKSEIGRLHLAEPNQGPAKTCLTDENQSSLPMPEYSGNEKDIHKPELVFLP